MTMDELKLMDARLLAARFAFEIVMAMVNEGLADDVSRDFAEGMARRLASLATGVTCDALEFDGEQVKDTFGLLF